MVISAPVYIQQDRVSILVFVELALDVRTSPQGCSPPGVSILVFVELALDELVTSGYNTSL